MGAWQVRGERGRKGGENDLTEFCSSKRRADARPPGGLTNRGRAKKRGKKIAILEA